VALISTEALLIIHLLPQTCVLASPFAADGCAYQFNWLNAMGSLLFNWLNATDSLPFNWLNAMGSLPFNWLNAMGSFAFQLA
jgi:hypothetical protein